MIIPSNDVMLRNDDTYQQRQVGDKTPDHPLTFKQYRTPQHAVVGTAALMSLMDHPDETPV